MPMRDASDCVATPAKSAVDIPLAGLARSVDDLFEDMHPATDCGKGGGRSVKGAEPPSGLGRMDALWLEGGKTDLRMLQSQKSESKRGETRMTFRTLFAATTVALGLATTSAFAQDAAIEAMQEYMMFSEYEAGIILPPQIDQAVFESVLFVDTRDEEQFEAATIPGAINIEWREVLDRIDEIPSDRKTILFCNTGSLSAQASFALRVAGRDNVVVLQTGFTGWQQDAAYKP